MMINNGLLLLVCLVVSSHLYAVQICYSEEESSATTPTSRFIIHGDGTVTDTHTGLQWMRCPRGVSGHDCSEGFITGETWANALSVAEGSLFAGYSDWRLPNIKELESIVEYQCRDHALNYEVFPDWFGNSDMFWSSTPSTFDPNDSMHLHYSSGRTGYTQRNDIRGVRLVRDSELFDQMAREEAYRTFIQDFIPLAKHEKCLNCHELERYNPVMLRHRAEGRITNSTGEDVCQACHTAALGYADGWRAPGSFFTDENMLMSNTTPEDLCASINRRRDPVHHLEEDELILWAIGQIPDVTVEDWQQMIDRMHLSDSGRLITCEPPEDGE